MECQKKESGKMLELMNAVLDKREKMQKLKKRDKKGYDKHGPIDSSTGKQSLDDRPIVQQIFKPSASAPKGETEVVAIDCEMVEVDRWGEGLARCSIVNAYGHILMDKYVIPEGSVTNYRTWVSGVTANHLKPENGAIPFKEAKQMAHKILKNKIIVGHSIKHDFDVIELPESDRPKEKIRDLIKFKKYQHSSMNPETK